MKNKLSTRLYLRFAATALICAACFAACIKDDIPYPHIQANFLTLTAAGESQASAIDSVNRTVTIYLPEEANIYNVDITDYTLTPGAELTGGPITGGINLETPRQVVLTLYQDYTWTISAKQDFERYFTVARQIGTSNIDINGRRVAAYVSNRADIKNLHVESLKLAPKGSTYEPDIEGKDVDFTNDITLSVTTHGVTQQWTIHVEQATTSVSTASVDAWTSVAWVYGEAEASRTNSIQYRLKGSGEWIDVPDEWITRDGGSFYARIIHLDPLTTYEARAVSDNEYGEILEFTTGYKREVPNSNFDSWWLDGKVWNPWGADDEQYWDTGNKGATTLGSSNSIPTNDTHTGTGQAAQLETRFVGISILGKLAAGNIFTGRYVRTEGTNGVLSFGREFDQRPTKLKGYLNYKTSAIDYASTEMKSIIGQPDTCIVWCALIDQDTPFEIRTNPSNRQLFDPDGAYVVAYGKIQYGHDTGGEGYIPFEFTLDYKSTSRVPKYIIITASASKYGDFFTGGSGSVLKIDDIELDYDY